MNDRSFPILLMTIGIPGSGKSTWIRNNKDLKDYIIVSPDLIRKEITGEISNVEKDRKVWKLAKKRVKKELKKGHNVILDATNVNGENRRKFLHGLPKCKLQAKIFTISPINAKKRIMDDIMAEKDRSHVPGEVIDAMYQRFLTESTLEQLEEEGFKILD
ncbi:MAG: AAA family ATPase [Promethearchaeota archaeon]